MDSLIAASLGLDVLPAQLPCSAIDATLLTNAPAAEPTMRSALILEPVLLAPFCSIAIGATIQKYAQNANTVIPKTHQVLLDAA